MTSVNSHLSIPVNAAQFKKLLLQEVLKDNENMEPLVITEADWENIKNLRKKIRCLAMELRQIAGI